MEKHHLWTSISIIRTKEDRNIGESEFKYICSLTNTQCSLRWWDWLTSSHLEGSYWRKWLSKLKSCKDSAIYCWRRATSLPVIVCTSSVSFTNKQFFDGLDHFFFISKKEFLIVDISCVLNTLLLLLFIGCIIMTNIFCPYFSPPKGSQNKGSAAVLGGVCDWQQLTVLLPRWQSPQNTQKTLYTQGEGQAAWTDRERYRLLILGADSSSSNHTSTHHVKTWRLSSLTLFLVMMDCWVSCCI